MSAAPPRLLYLGPPESEALVRHRLGGALEVDLALDEETVDRCLPRALCVLDAYMRVRFTAERLARARSLKLVVTATTGADHIDADALAARGIPLLTLRGQRELLGGLTAAAEHSWLLLLACARRLAPAARQVLDGGWDRNEFPGWMLKGRTLGIVGCGRIGGWMARYAAAFDMRCLGYDPYAEELPPGVEPVELEELLRRADAVTVHVPLEEGTRHLLGREQLEAMKPGAILVNTSRGEVIDEAALLEALEGGRLGAAGLDVLTGEPEIAGHPLVDYARHHPNLLITPHIGGFSPDALGRVLAFSCDRIRSFLDADG